MSGTQINPEDIFNFDFSDPVLGEALSSPFPGDSFNINDLDLSNLLQQSTATHSSSSPNLFPSTIQPQSNAFASSSSSHTQSLTNSPWSPPGLSYATSPSSTGDAATPFSIGSLNFNYTDAGASTGGTLFPAMSAVAVGGKGAQPQQGKGTAGSGIPFPRESPDGSTSSFANYGFSGMGFGQPPNNNTALPPLSPPGSKGQANSNQGSREGTPLNANVNVDNDFDLSSIKEEPMALEELLGQIQQYNQSQAQLGQGAMAMNTADLFGMGNLGAMDINLGAGMQNAGGLHGGGMFNGGAFGLPNFEGQGNGQYRSASQGQGSGSSSGGRHGGGQDEDQDMDEDRELVSINDIGITHQPNLNRNNSDTSNSTHDSHPTGDYSTPSSVVTDSRKPSITASDPSSGSATPTEASANNTTKNKNKRKRVAITEPEPENRERSESVVDLDEEDGLPSLPAMFGGVKGKGGKKGGGLSSVVMGEDEEAGEDDDWRPSAEEYKKLSSKEKRQLRNKLSARAFRNRRKTYINELEDHIKDRDRLIDAIRSELKNFRSENDELRQEINMMKKAAMSPSQELTASPLTASTTAKTNAVAAPSRTNSSSSSINTFNPRKDLPSSTSAILNSKSPRTFWGAGDNGGGYTSVHTTFMPDLALPPAHPAQAPKFTTVPIGSFNMPRQNLNPHLNDNAANKIGGVYAVKADGQDMQDSFDGWSSENTFSYRSLDAYRMQLWSRMARDASLAKQGVPQELRPKFLKDPTAELERRRTLSNEKMDIKNLIADATNPFISQSPQPEMAPALAKVVSSAISTRLFSAFISAFQAPTGRGLDGERVSAVFTGKAGLKVVPSSPIFEKKSFDLPIKAEIQAPNAAQIEADAALAASFANLKMATESMGISGIKTPPATSKDISATGKDEIQRGWGFLTRSTVR